MNADHSRALSALRAISPNLPREEWVRVGMAAKAEGLTFDDFNEWSSPGANYSERDARAAWHSFKVDGGIGAATLYFIAQKHGWHDGINGTAPAKPAQAIGRTSKLHGTSTPREGPDEVWARCVPATHRHSYIVRKGADSVPLDDLRVVPDGDPLRINGVSMAGALAKRVCRGNGSTSTLQFILPVEVAERLKAQGKSDKLNLPGFPVEGWFTVRAAKPGDIYICEGIGGAWSCWKATGATSVDCCGSGRMRTVATELRQHDPEALLVLVSDRGKEKESEAIAREVSARVVHMREVEAQNFDANDFALRDGHDALADLLSRAQAPETEPLPFSLVPIADLATVAPTPPAFVWDGLVPSMHVTLFAAHGGVGKSFLALMLAVAVALGLPLFGIPTRRGVVAYYSGEDGAHVLRARLAHICSGMGVAVERLEGRLFILDATDEDPTLFAEVTTAGRKEGATTKTYASLRSFAADKEISLLVVDNASDAFDANEIDRARVRGFIRSLARIGKERDAGVLLLAHVDKGTSRKERSDTEGYSGSTAWHNSSRSRLFMTRDEDGSLLLQQQKYNLGKRREPLRLVWSEGGIPALDEAFGPMVQGIADRGHEKALLKLIAEFAERGEHVTTATTSRTNAAKLLRHEPGFPRMRDGEVFNLLRSAERAGYLERISYKGPDRKDRERWALTNAGRAFAALPAATAATPDVTAPAQSPPEPAATAATSPPGGVGGKARTFEQLERLASEQCRSDSQGTQGAQDCRVPERLDDSDDDAEVFG